MKNLSRGLAALMLGSALCGQGALADCCGPVPVPREQFQLGSGWSGSVIYEHMEMRSLLRGSDKVSAETVLTERLNAGAARYSVPTRMYMDRAAVQLRYQFDEEHSLRVTLPWRINQMDMKMASKAGAGGGGGHAHHRIFPQAGHDVGHEAGHHAGHEVGHGAGHDANHGSGHDSGHGDGHDAGHDADHGGGHDAGPGGHDGHGAHGGHAQPGMGAPSFMDMTMDQLDGLGDINLTYNYTFDLDGHTAWVGGGVSLPTGTWDARDSQGQLIHNMMQPGSGAVGLLAEAGADFTFGDSPWSLHPRASLQWNGTNPLGYQRGSRLDYQLGTRYRVADSVGLSLDLVGFVAARDHSNGALDPVTGQVAFQRPETSLADDVTNTGGEYLFLAPGLRANPTENIALGLEYRFPIYQNVRGTQLGIDGWYRVFMSAKF